MTRPCVICGVEFKVRYIGIRFCSQKCRNRNRYIEHPAEMIAANKRHYERLKAERRSTMYREAAVKTKYGLTLEEYDTKLSSSPLCGLCGEPFDKTKRNLRPVLDHNHKTGKLREFLHNGCNIGIGFLGDSSEKVQKALNYLNKHVT